MPRTARRIRRFATAALVAAGVSVAAALPMQASATTMSFTSKPQSAGQGIDLGTAEAPSLGTTADKLVFRANGQDRRALAAAKKQQDLLEQQDAASAASTEAAERIAAIEELLDQAQRDEEQLRAAIHARLVEQYKGGGTDELEFLLSGNGLSDLLERGHTLNDQTRRDQRMMERYEYTVARLEQLEQVLSELRDIQSERAVNYGKRAERLEETLVAARAAHMEAPESEASDEDKGIAGTWYIMDGAFQAQLFLPSGLGQYDGGTRTPKRPATAQQIQAVLADTRIELDASGRTDVATGQIDGRLLDALSAAAQQFGFVKVTSLKSDHGVYTASGNVSEHSYGCAADIGTIGSTYITGASQTPGSEVERAVIFFAGLGSLKPDLAPHQVISLFDLGGATLRMGDHDDHIHVGYAC